MTCSRKIGPFDCCTVVQGDCLELMKQLPDGCVDAVITSPPYNLVKENSGGSTTYWPEHDERYQKWYDDEMPEHDYQLRQKREIVEMLRVSAGSVFYNHKVRYALARRGEVYHPMTWLRDFPLYCEIIWDRCGATGGNSGRYLLADERVYQLKPPRVFNGALGLTNVWRIPPEHVDGHVCAFPVQLVENCILPNTGPGMTVLDPHMGSGTTGVAAKKLGRHFLGFEISPEYCQIARDRIARVEAQPNLFASKPEQQELKL